MKNLKIVLILVIVSFSSKAQFFNKAFKLQSTEDERGVRIITDKAGDVIVTGYFGASVDFDPSTTGAASLTPTGSFEGDVFIAKYDANFNYKWAVKFGNSQFDDPYALTTDGSDNIIVGGDFVKASNTSDRDGFVNKYDANGTLIFSIPIGGTSKDVVHGVATDAGKNIYVTGYIGGTVDFDPSTTATFTLQSNGGRDFFLAKYDSTGKFIWAHNTGGTMSTAYEEGGEDLVIAGSNIYVTGQFEGAVDFDFSTSAAATVTSNGSLDIFVAKYDTDGNYKWAFNAGSSNKHDFAKGIDIDASENVYITGGFEETVDFDPSAATATLTSASVAANDIFVASYNSAGSYLWAFKAGGSSLVDDIAFDIDVIGSDLYLTGTFWGPCDFDPSAGAFTINTSNNQIFLARYTTGGSFVWAFEIGSTSGTGPADKGYGIHMASNGNLYATGDFYNNADFDPSLAVHSLGGNNRGHAYVASYGPALFVGINESILNGTRVIAFPNPSDDKLTVLYENRTAESWAVKIFNLQGQLIYDSGMLSTDKHQVDISHLAEGIYIYSVSSAGTTTTQKLVVK